MTASVDYVSIEVGTRSLEAWQSYDLDSDLMQPADAWRVVGHLTGTYRERQAQLARIREAGGRVFIYVQRVCEDGSAGPRALQMTGVVDRVSVEGDRDNGAQLIIQGTDNGGLLTRAAADPRLGVTSETTLVDMVVGACAPFGITVVTEHAPARTLATGQRASRGRSQLLANHARSYGVPAPRMRRALTQDRAVTRATRNVPMDEASGAGSSTRAAERARRGHASGMTGSDVERLTIAEAKPQVGETVWDFIDRHCRRLGVMPWIDARGRLVISSPDYDQEPLFQLRRYLDPTRHPAGNNIIAGGYAEDWSVLSSECTVYGRAFGADASRSPFHATERNPLQPLYRPLTISDPSVRSEAEARRAARRELNRQNERAYSLEYTVASHGQGPNIWAQETTVDVVDEEIGIEGIYYVTARRFTGDRDSGPMTRLRLVPLGAIQL